MHQFDQFKQDMEKMAKSNLPNPIKSGKTKGPKSERSAFDLTELNRQDIMKLTNFSQFDGSQVFQHCTVLTIDGVPGFAWYDPATGQRHDEEFTWPTMQIHKDATVEVLFGPDGERSAGWRKSD